MDIRTVEDLKSYLSGRDISPETLSRETKISNMTIRRLLKKSNETRIPNRYVIQLNWKSQNQIGFDDFDSVLLELEKSGKKASNPEEIGNELREKLKDRNIGRGLAILSRKILNQIGSTELGKRNRLILIGALVYFINPFDLIPDAIPSVGFLDDFAILSLAWLKAEKKA